MKPLLLAIILLLAGMVIYLLLTRKAPDIVVGPDQKTMDSFRASQERKTDSLIHRMDSIEQKYKRDSLAMAQTRKQDQRVIKNLKAKEDAYLAQLNDSTPCCEASEIKSAVIDLKDVRIEKLESMLYDEQEHSAMVQANFEARLATMVGEKEVLKAEIGMMGEQLQAKDRELKKKKLANTIKTIVIGGLVILLGIK